jgi:hypothetical protein
MKQLHALARLGPTVVPLNGRGASTFYLRGQGVGVTKTVRASLQQGQRNEEFCNTYTYEGTETD